MHIASSLTLRPLLSLPRGQNIESDVKAITGSAPRKFAKFVKDALKPAMDA